MHASWRRLCLALGAMALATIMIVAGGCGGGGKPATGSGSGSGSAPVAGNLNSAFKDVVLKVGRIPFTNSTEMVKKHEALLNYLQSELGIKEARLILAKDYNGILDKLSAGEIDIGWLGTAPYVEGKDKYRLKPLVKPIRFGSDSYRGIIITRQDSGIKRLTDLKGKRFAWVEKESASGYLFPKSLLVDAGMNPATDFSEASFLGKHDAVVLNVLLGKFDAGACYDDARNTLKDKEKINELTILATTENIANEPLVCRDNLPEELQTKVKEALLKLNIDDPRYKKVLEECTDVQSFAPAVDDDYNSARKMLRIKTAR